MTRLNRSFQFRRTAACWASVAILFCIGSAQIQADIIRQTPGSEYLVVEAEDYEEILGDEFTTFLEVGVDTDEETDFGSELLPDDSNVSGTALYDQPGNSNFVDAVNYQLEFAEPGDYTVYLRYTMYETSGEENTYGNEDSFYFPLELGEEPEQDGWFSLPKLGNDGAVQDPPFWEGNFNWAGPINFNVSGTPIEYQVGTADVGSAIDFGISTREHGSTLDAFIFHQDPFLLAEDLDDLLGETVGPGMPGDFDGDGMLGESDLSALAGEVRAGTNNADFDLDGNGVVDLNDHNFWVTDLKGTWVGDSNFDGEFNSGDFVEVFTKGEYEDTVAGNSTWSEGDWDANGDFDSGDFVAAFVDGGFENGPRPATASVPEPAIWSLLTMGLLASLWALRRR